MAESLLYEADRRLKNARRPILPALCQEKGGAERNGEEHKTKCQEIAAEGLL